MRSIHPVVESQLLPNSLWEMLVLDNHVIAGDRYIYQPDCVSLWVSKIGDNIQLKRIRLDCETVTSVVRWPFRQDCVLVTTWGSVLLVSLADAAVIAEVSVPNVGRAAVSPSGHVALAVNGPPNFPYARVFLYAADRHRAAAATSEYLSGFERPPCLVLGELGPAFTDEEGRTKPGALAWLAEHVNCAHYGRLHDMEWIDDHTLASGGWDAAVRLWHLPGPWASDRGNGSVRRLRAFLGGAVLVDSNYDANRSLWLSSGNQWCERRDAPARPGTPASIRDGHFGRVERLAARPPMPGTTAHHVASVGYDGRVLVWAAEDGRMAAQALVAPPPDMEVLRRDCLLRGEDPPRPPPMLCGLSWLDPNHLAVSSFDGELTVLRFDEAAGRLTTVAETRLVTREPIYAVAALGDGRFASAGPAVQIWELGPERGLRREQPHPERFFISASLRDSASDIPSAGSARSEPSYSASYY